MADPKREPCDKLDVTNFGKSGGIVNGAKWYSVRGGMQDFNYLSSNDFEITLELGCRKYTQESDLEKEWNNNKDSLINFIWQVSLNVLMLYDIVSIHDFIHKKMIFGFRATLGSKDWFEIPLLVERLPMLPFELGI